MPSIAVGQPTTMSDPSWGSIAYRCVPAVGIAIVYLSNSWELPPHGGGYPSRGQRARRPKSGQSPELHREAHTVKSGLPFAFFAVKRDDVVILGLERITQGFCDIAGLRQGGSVRIHLHPVQVDIRWAGQRVFRRAVDDLRSEERRVGKGDGSR